ncbi:MAG: acyl-CoA dehydrogenase family protein, partial [Gammaproteobacteria bacterium]|nr:acyl-CoA dehydrogenase family protein [Gammaproteobacteria bacterium]
MTQRLLNDRDLDFLLYEFLDTDALLKRPRYQEHSREVFNATLETAKTVAEKYFANHNAKGDANEPSFDGETVHQIPETREAWDAFAEAGFLAAHYDFEDGGMQLPEIILRVAMSYMTAANIATAGYPFLSIGAANLIQSFGGEAERAKYLPPMQAGRFAGTMALTEPGQGSALADITTTARPADDGSYRIVGQKMFISGGDQSITENIVHLVLAKIEGAPAGAKGISLFICPKFLVNDDGSLGERNDVALAGLLHKMGYRNTTST